MNSFAVKRSSQGRRSWRVFGSADCGRYVGGGVRSSFDPTPKRRILLVKTVIGLL